MATARTSIPRDRLIQLEELAARYATLTANIPVGLFRSTPGPTGRFIEVNPALAEILGFDTMTELLTIDVSSLYLDPLERQRFSDKLAAKGFVKNEELSYRKKDGTRIVVSETAIAVRDADGALQYFDGIVEDITERKQAEDELLVQKAYLEQLFNSAPEAIVLHDTNDRVVNINAEFTRLFGYAREEAVGRLLNELVAPAEFMDEASFLSDQVIHGTQVETESQRRRKDGQLIDVSILGAPILHDGKQMGVYAIYRNITERKKAEDALRIQKTYFERLFNSAPEAIALHSNTDRIANINREFSRMFGYTREEAIGRQINTLIVPASLQQEAADVSRRVLSGERIELDTKRMRKDSTLIDVSVLGAPIVHEGVQIGDYAIYRDIGERKRAEEELLVQKAYLEQLFNSAPEAIVLHDSDDRVVNVNTEFTQMFGYTREEAVGQFINDLVAPKKLRNEADFFSKSVIGGERIEADSQRRRKDGSLIDVSIMGAPIVTGGKQIGVYAIYRDITERKRAEESRIRAQEEARLARNIQLRLLPSEPPQIAGYDIAGKNLPALNVGGDYYDFIRLDDHRIAIALGDVSGKGIASSLVMANIQATIRSLTLFDAEPDRCMGRANTLVYRSTDVRTFVSLFYGILDTRRHVLTYANAGQDLPVHFSANSVPRQLQRRGIALGIKEDVAYEKEEIPFASGDRLLLYSDGIVEAMNTAQEEFGEERLHAIVAATTSLSAAEAITQAIQAVTVHVAPLPQHDDMTIVLIKRN